jgi:phenylacetate-coenzyme A ligase PaaK-like adenylate-forming protein
VQPFSQIFKSDLLSGQRGHFEPLALRLFRYQATHNPVYTSYLRHLRREPEEIKTLAEIPFLPVSFFKTHPLVTGDVTPSVVFESSGTTGQIPSRHYVHDPAFYQKISQTLFEEVYGPLDGWHILALLPSYLERNGASLVYMIDHFIRCTGSPESGFYLNNQHELAAKLTSLRQSPRKTLLIGVTFALLDLAEAFNGIDLSHVTVMETGGMKGRRTELLREEVHQILKSSFNLPAVHSEYGMTELLSQAYAPAEGEFTVPPTMRILLRDINDPFSINNELRSGGINIIDLANVDSCAFIETQDLGTFTGPDRFRVLGRFDNSDIRGCNLMVQ